MKYLLPLFFTGMVAIAQPREVDPAAVLILDKMSTLIGQLQSCNYTLSTSTDVEDYPYGLVKNYGYAEVYMAGPDKMVVHTHQNDHHKGYWYNGDSLTYYSFDENNYVKIPTPNTILKTIDSLKATYEIDFPAADFFYPTFTDDILNNFDQLHYIGEDVIDHQNCFHLKAENKDMAVQIWIANESFTHPVQVVIAYKGKENTPRYEAKFENWEVNPVLPNAMFEFTPPAGARLIAIMAISEE